MSFLTHLECALCGRELEADRLWNLCPACDKPLLARYDLERASRTLTREEFADKLIGRTQGMFVCPEGAATLAGFQRLRRQGWIADDEMVALLNTGSGHKYAHLWG